MWVCTPLGFFCVGCPRPAQRERYDQDELLIGALRIADLENLRDHYPPLQCLPVETPAHPPARYYLAVPREIWVQILAEMLSDIEYTELPESLQNAPHGYAGFLEALAREMGRYPEDGGR